MYKLRSLSKVHTGRGAQPCFYFLQILGGGEVVCGKVEQIPTLESGIKTHAHSQSVHLFFAEHGKGFVARILDNKTECN